MASSKKSLVDRFTFESKPKSPGKKSRKSSKASKSLSRELTKSPASPGISNKRAGKSGSDTLVALRKESDDEICRDVTKHGSHDSVEPMEIEFEKPVHIEKLETSLTASWNRPEESIYSPMQAPNSDLSEPDAVFGSPSVTTPLCSPVSVCSSAESQLTPSPLPMTTPSPQQILALSASSVSSCPSTDSLASEMESYRLGSRSSSTSDVDTLKNSACEEINISECSSTSTPIKFGLFEHSGKEHVQSPLARKAPPKFSLIREVATEELDSLSLSSDYSPTTTGTSFKSLEGRSRIDDFSDESDSSRMKESSEFSDDPDFHSHGHFVPLNKQLQIVTSMDRLIDR